MVRQLVRGANRSVDPGAIRPLGARGGTSSVPVVVLKEDRREAELFLTVLPEPGRIPPRLRGISKDQSYTVSFFNSSRVS